MKKQIHKKVCAVLFFLGWVLLFCVVGSFDNNRIPLSAGAILGTITVVTIFVSGVAAGLLNKGKEK